MAIFCLKIKIASRRNLTAHLLPINDMMSSSNISGMDPKIIMDFLNHYEKKRTTVWKT